MNCKPGDLAVVVRDEFPENIGAFVTVGEYEPDGWGDYGTPGWLCVTSSRLIAMDAYDGHSYRTRVGETVLIPDSDLRPIRPPAAPVESHRELEAA